MKKLLLLLITTTTLSSAFAASFTCDLNELEVLHPGVTQKDLKCADENKRAVIAHVITADSKLIKLQPIGLNSPTDKSLKPLPAIAADSALKSKIIAGINGGFFNMTTIGYGDDMCPMKTYLNKGEGNSYLLIDNKDWAQNCISRPVIAFADGVAPMIVPYLAPDESLSNGIANAVGGGPTLVLNKNITIDNPNSYPWINSRAARTAVGLNGNQVLLVNIEAKRGDKTTGMTIPELASFMHDTLGVSDAINLDGGGSSTMCKGPDCNTIINVPTDGKARKIHDGIFILSQ